MKDEFVSCMLLFAVFLVTLTVLVVDNNKTNVLMAEKGYCAVGREGTSSAVWGLCK